MKKILNQMESLKALVSTLKIYSEEVKYEGGYISIPSMGIAPRKIPA